MVSSTPPRSVPTEPEAGRKPRALQPPIPPSRDRLGEGSGEAPRPRDWVGIGNHPWWLVVSALLLLFGVLGGGCAQDLGDVVRTQPRALKKSVFRTYNDDGSYRAWYFRQTVVEVPFSTAATWVGEQTEVEKVFWEITEKTLYAYRTHEYVKGAEKDYQRPATGGFKGAAVAAFAIESHFDIKREYNPSTGEQTNVIAENTTDRP